jgi:hypothetical protein
MGIPLQGKSKIKTVLREIEQREKLPEKYN